MVIVSSPGMDPGGGWGDASPPPPDLRLGKGIPKMHAKFVENESKMSKITHHLHPLEISGSTHGPVQFFKEKS